MTVGLNGNKLDKILIYIPCHTDFRDAIDQAIFIRSEFELIEKKKNDRILELHLHISVNGTDLNSTQLSKIKDVTQSYTYTDVNIGADSNISNGFILGAASENSFLWILSANERLKPGGLSLIFEVISQIDEEQILLIGNDKNFERSTLRNSFQEALQGKPLGLISAVIFNSNLCRNSFYIASQYSWTGWGQLSVLDSIQRDAKEIKYVNVEQSSVYTLDARKEFDKSKEFERIGKTYSRSFFGLPVLVNQLYTPPNNFGRMFMRRWLMRNIHLVAYFESFISDQQAIRVKSIFDETLRNSGKFNQLLFAIFSNNFWLIIFRLIKNGK